MMQCLKDEKLKFNENTLYNVRKEFNLHKPGEMEKVVDILEEWVKQQNHFTKKQFPREDLERMIIMNKGSIERTKRKLDKTLTFRTLIPEYFVEYDISNDFKEFDGILFQAVLPKMTDDDCRVYMFQNIGKKFESTLLHTFYRTIALFSEYLRTHDYARSFIVVIDYREVNLMELVSKLNPIELRKGIALLTEGYGFRMKGFHILSDSKFIEVVVKIFKQVMSQKLGERIQVHKTLENLYKFVPKEVLPEDFGGSEKTLIELNALAFIREMNYKSTKTVDMNDTNFQGHPDEWFKLFGSKEFKKFFKETSKAKVDETLRPIDQFNDQCLGLPGTFRSITVD